MDTIQHHTQHKKNMLANCEVEVKEALKKDRFVNEI